MPFKELTEVLPCPTYCAKWSPIWLFYHLKEKTDIPLPMMMLRCAKVRQALPQQSQDSKWSQTSLRGPMDNPSAMPPLLTLRPGREVKDHEPWGSCLGEGYIVPLKHVTFCTLVMTYTSDTLKLVNVSLSLKGTDLTHWSIHKNGCHPTSARASLTLTFGLFMVTCPYA